FGVTTRTLRHYEDQGLLHPQREGMNRIFSARDRARLKLALRAKRLGFSLSEIRELFELYDLAGGNEKTRLEQLVVTLEKRRVLLERQRADIEAMLNEIAFFAEQCRRRLATASSGTGKKMA
ncbi:MAG: MerR family DNA-binding transcriptional regulator, partial [Burkholderiales bacterium]|nr:MerR family DNA-binding transcriptional regulator [Burkholderiales bacterium]